MAENNFSRNDIILKPDGSRITRESLLNDAVFYYQNAYQNKFTDVCDFAEGSEIRTLHESFIVELFSLYKEMYRMAKMKFVLDSEGTFLDRLGCEYHLKRKRAKPATGSVTFSTNQTLNGDYRVPRGTVILSHTDGYEYILEQDVTIRSSATPTNGTVHSALDGSRYNVEAGQLTAFQGIDGIRYGISVTNTSPITGGEDEESDHSFKSRILRAKRQKSWGTTSEYNNLIREKVPGIHDVQFVDPVLLTKSSKYPEHYKSDGKTRCTECTRVLFVNGFMKPVTNQLLNEVDYVMTQQNNLVVGQLFHVQKAEPVRVVLSMELWCTSMVDEDLIYQHLVTFFDGGILETKRGDMEYSGVNIGETVTKNHLLYVLENVPGVEQVGRLYQMKYDTTIRDDATWIANDDSENTYTWTDKDGYTFSKGTHSKDKVDYWGYRNFTEITCLPGQVLMCGTLQDYVRSSPTLLEIDMHLVDEKS